MRQLPIAYENHKRFCVSGCIDRNSGGSGSPSMLEDLRRGHEGLMVKLNDVTRALKVCACVSRGGRGWMCTRKGSYDDGLD